MNCRVCESTLDAGVTDLPLNVSDKRVVILKELPVLQCPSCSEYLIEDVVFERVEQILAVVGPETALRIVRYAE